jgi:hypothetical protein
MGYTLLLGFLLVIVGTGLVILLFLSLSEKQSFDPLFMLCIAICSLISLCVGIYILYINW